MSTPPQYPDLEEKKAAEYVDVEQPESDTSPEHLIKELVQEGQDTLSIKSNLSHWLTTTSPSHRSPT